MTTNQQEIFNEGFAKGMQAAFKAFKFGAVDFEPKNVIHFCDICDNEYYGTDAEAKERGWEIAPNGSVEFCWEHNG